MGKVVIMHVAIACTLVTIAAAQAAIAVGTQPLLVEPGRYSPKKRRVMVRECSVARELLCGAILFALASHVPNR
jgi:hypothetical protein